MFFLAASPVFAETPAVFDLDSVTAGSLGAPGALVPEASGPVPPYLSKAGYIQMTSSTKLKMDKEKGELTVAFPKVEFGGDSAGDKAQLFVKITRETPVPAISWAAVLCSNGHYLGYKGSTVNFPEKSGSFSISETLALGAYPSRLITRTHPWLAGDDAALAEICSDGFLEKMKDARIETLPSRIGNFTFEYNSRKNTLKARWR